VLAPVLVPLLFGPQWGPSILLMQLMVPSTALAALIYFDRSALVAIGRAKDAFWLAVGNTGLGLACVLLGVPWGAVGVAVGRSIRQFAYWPVRLSLLRRRLGLDPLTYLRQFAQPAAGAAVSTAVMWAVTATIGQPLVALAIAAPAGTAAYLAVMWLIARHRIAALLHGVRLPGRQAVGAQP
jgi:teichuronic acid exporter